MRYVRTKTAVTTVTDEMVDGEEVQAILSVLKDKELDCSMQLNNGARMDLVRISGIFEGEFAFRVIYHKSSLRKKAKYSDISYLEVNTVDSEMVRTKPGISRWMLLDSGSGDN